MEPQPPDSNSPQAHEEALDKMKSTYRTLDQRLAIREEDNIALIILKVGLRLLAVGVMILLSPFLLIGLLVAFMAVL
jgi:hypothetical protein